MANIFGKAKKARNKSDSTNKHKKPVKELIDYIIENADIILEVVDARLIDKTRQESIEKKIEALGKKIIFVINKSDLARIEDIYRNIELERLRPYVLFSAKTKKGIPVLKKIVKKEAKKLRKDSVNVGIIGYPNTGKSSIVNVLAGRSSAKVSSESGYTKSLQKVRLSKGIYLIDSPGIISDEKNVLPERKAYRAQIGAISWSKAKNPEMAISKIMENNKGVLEEHYNVSANGDSELLVEELGRRMHFLKRGGNVDETKTAKTILRDWQEGKIKIRQS